MNVNRRRSRATRSRYRHERSEIEPWSAGVDEYGS